MGYGFGMKTWFPDGSFQGVGSVWASSIFQLFCEVSMFLVKKQLFWALKNEVQLFQTTAPILVAALVSS